jgi:predicted membrane protein
MIVRPYRTHCHSRRKKGMYFNRTHHNFKKGDINVVFGSGNHIILDPVFEGGEVNTVFGEVTLDLRKTALPEGKNVSLEINVVFGYATILVPETWNVKVHATPVAGSFIDKRDVSGCTADISSCLDIHVQSVFSGGELSN